MSDASTAFSIDTPLLATQCSPIELHWAGGTPPYNITVATTFEKVLANYSTTNTSTTWIANVTAGAAVAVFGTDAGGAFGNSDLFVMSQGTSDSCLQHNKKALSSGAIAGIAVGGAVVCVAAFAFLVWTRRRRHRGDWPRGERVDLNGSSLAPAQPQLSSKAMSRERERRAEGAEAAVKSSGSSVVEGSIFAEVEDYTPRADADVVAIVDSQILLSARPPPIRSKQDGSDSAATTQESHSSRSALAHGDAQPCRERDRVPAHALDGGVRLAGGPIDGFDDADATATLPPPYRRY